MSDTRNEFFGLSQAELDTLLGKYFIFDKLTHKKLPLDENRIEALLKAGANPNYQNDNGDTLLHEAIRSYSKSLVALLIKYGVDVNQHFIPPYRFPDPSKTDEKLQWAVEHERTSLQVITEKYYRARRDKQKDEIKEALECYDLVLPKFSIPLEYAATTESIQQLYINLHYKIRKELQLANRKPVVVVLGESHLSLVSLLIESFIFLICKQFNFNLYLTETDKNNFEILKNGGIVPGSFADWKTIYDNLPFALDLGYEAVPVDLGTFGGRKIGKNFNDYEEIDPYESKIDPVSEKGMIYRDQVMHDVISESVNQNAILIAGASHLIGLQKQKFNNHHIVFINASNFLPNQITHLNEIKDKYQRRAAEFLLSSRSVYQPRIHCLKEIDYFWHPGRVIETAKNVHAILTNILNWEIVPLSSKWLFTPSNDVKKEEAQQTRKNKCMCAIL